MQKSNIQFNVPRLPQQQTVSQVQQQQQQQMLLPELPVDTLSANISSSAMDNYIDAQQELHSPMTSSFGNLDGNTLNQSSEAPAPQNQWQCVNIKLGEVGRSVDLSRFSGYDDLKGELARMFETELEDLEKLGWIFAYVDHDLEKLGWKFAYVDHEGDLLLMGDDRWENFVKCVRRIKILAPQEIQQIRVAAFRNTILPNQNSGNPSAG